MNRIRIGIVLVLSAAFALETSAEDAHAKEKPNILLLTVDTLRPDYLGCYGYPHAISPAADSLAEKGTLFEDAVTTIGKTGPAFSSLFTSQYPPTHGARRNGIRMRPDLTGLPEVLKRHGYTTAAVISNWTLKDKLCGLKRGFDHYDEDFHENRAGPIAEERLAPEVTKRAVEWLKNKPDGPLFYWVHYSDPHWPYVRRKDFLVDLPEQAKNDRGREKREGYACEVRFTDHAMQAFLDEALKSLSLEDTYLIFASDHGESLGEHDYWGHGKNCYQQSLRIPLVIAGPGVPAGKRLKHPVSMIDLMPTILSFAGLPSPSGVLGVDLNGIWERPVEPDRRRYAFADRGASVVSHSPRKHRHPLSMCLIWRGWKVVYDFRFDYDLYFDLETDPRELQGLRKRPIELDESPSGTLVAWYEKLPKYYPKAGERVGLSKEDLAKLKSLGY